ncbi:efflux RND transporter periplasmic adaptor subunit [Salegentibacter sp. LM13S]|uniref:efflux RND transporter periplasmic adaptor subunit n=1 Tax=Salegentibacter lacus TaxID=2873599 RepID=UPI001CCD6CC6|nr:efflux RND transporter periplasmic adaptor subunit [Salegentibacter lacus]MBZ9631589.1 efflux RND transporter periplasmic adaptor subunit [Salegentibacter lacus]
MKTKKAKILLSVSLIVILLISAYYILNTDNEPSFIVETVPVKRGEINTLVTATGTIEPLTKVAVGTQVSGEVEKIYADYNSEVKKGQLLAELDKTNLKAALGQAQASYENALNEKEYYGNIFKRQQGLYEEEVISRADFEEATYNYNLAKTQVTQSLSNLQEAKTNLGFADIYSPIDGVVLSKEVDEGQTVAASFETPTLFTIAKDLRQMQVEASVDEADIGNVKEGQRVTFTVDAYQGETFEGIVTQVRLSPIEQESVITYTVVIKAQNPDLKLKPGLTATVVIYTLELNEVLTIEAKALNFKPNPNQLIEYNEQYITGEKQPREIPETSQEDMVIVWKHTEDNRILPEKIEVGASDGINTEVVSGLSEGDKLVYNLKTNANRGVRKESSSPFMPTPPGNNKNKPGEDE